MTPTQVRERVRERPAQPAVQSQPQATPAPLSKQPVSQPRVRPARPRVPAHPRHHQIAARRRIEQHQQDERVQHELKEMRQTHDLRDIDDDVEDVATLYAWRAEEHTHRPKTARWFITLAVGTTIVVGVLLFLGNLIGALTIALVGGLTYYIAQQKPAVVRYRIMVDGIAINNTLYHYRDLEKFNIVYEPGETKTIIFLSKHKFSPYIHMEIGDADPLEIRDILLEFLPEDIEMDEPLVDIVARRLGF